MDALLSILQPPEQLGEIQARMAAVLSCSRHELLSADAPVLPEPGEPPLPRMRASEIGRRRVRKVRPNPNAKHTTYRAQVLLALTDEPQDYAAIAQVTGLPRHVVRSCLGNLSTRRLVVNLSANGQAGRWVVPRVETPKVARGPFDV